MEESFAIFREANDAHVKICKGNLVLLQSNWNMNNIPSGYLISPWAKANEIYQIQGEMKILDIENLNSFLEGQNLQLQNTNQVSTSFDSFSTEVLSIQGQISLGNLEKAVASRVHVDEVDFNLGSIVNWYKQLLIQHETALVALVYTPSFGLWIGASPETLIQLEENELTTMSLAGTLTKENDQWSNKEKLEQSVTTKFILEIFNKLDLLAPLDTGIVESKSGKLRHLQSVFKVIINPELISQILMDFSPTPAVGGYPKEKAVEWINKEEDFQRELFTGFWGPKYNTTLKLNVNLRCAKITQNKQLFYAGCGINLGSDVLNEWNETSAKMKVTSDFRD